MMTCPTEWKKHVPNHQPVIYDHILALRLPRICTKPASGGFSGLRWITYFGIWSSQMDPNGCRMTACDFSWISPHVLQQGNLGIISSRSAYWSYFASQISQLDLGSCLISGKPCSITFKSFDFVLGGHHTSRFQKDVQHQTPLREFSILLKARASLQVKLQLVVFSQLGCHLPPDGKAIVLDENLAPPKKLSKSYSFGCF